MTLRNRKAAVAAATAAMRLCGAARRGLVEAALKSGLICKKGQNPILCFIHLSPSIGFCDVKYNYLPI